MSIGGQPRVTGPGKGALSPSTLVTGGSSAEDGSAPLPADAEYKDGVIVEQVAVADGQGNIRQFPINTDTRREYVGSMANVWGAYITGIRSLPHSIDDITRNLGADLYDRMAYDPQIASLINIMKAATLSQPVDLTPAITDENNPRFKVAEQIHDHMHRCFEALKPTLPVVLDNMLDALYLGNKVAERVYVDGEGDDVGRHVLRKLSVKHRNALFFVVDRFGNTLGFTPAVAASSFGNFGVGLYDPEKQELVAEDKFAVLSFRPKDGDPRGTSLFRPAYNAWWLKMQVWPELLKYLAQFGGPGIIGFTAPDSRDIITPDGAGGKITQTPEEIMLGQLENWRNGSVAAFPFGALVTIAQATGNGEAFLNTISMLNRELTKAITGQELATSEGQHQARAASEVHASILELAIVLIKEMVCLMLEREVMLPSVLLNWGPDYADLIPRASLGEVKKQDKAALMSAYVAAGYEVHPSQLVAIDTELNVPPRDPASIQEMIDQKKAEDELALQPPVIAAPPGAKPGTGRTSSTAGTRTPPKPQPARAVQNRRSS